MKQEQTFDLKEKLERILNDKKLVVSKKHHYEFKLKACVSQLLSDYDEFNKSNYIEELRNSYKL